MPNLVGTGLNQVPTNSMLGGLAYQDPEHASIKDLDLKNLSQINSEIADTAVDVFVYDTRKDSDGGAWRKRTQHTSWYNETLGTATRGTRKEFPAVAVIVVENTSVTIYDGDDPDLPMWMVFNTINGMIFTNSNNLKSVSMLNGILVWTSFRSGIISFIPESAELLEAGYAYGLRYGLVNRNTSGGWNVVTGRQIVNNGGNDIAMTVLPNAPIDDATGLPVPTIAVATDGGVSVLKDDGTVYDVIDSNGSRRCFDVSFTKDHKIMHTGDLGAGSTHAGNVFVTNILTADRAEYDNHSDLYRWYTAFQYYPRINGGNTFNTRVLDPIDVGGHHYAMADVGVSLIEDGTSTFAGNTNGMVAYITSDYNSGYQHGDIKGAFLSDTDTTDAIEYVQNGYFNSDVSSWTIGTTGTTATLNANRLLLTAPTSGSSWGYVYQGITTEVGKTYKISLKYDRGTVDGRVVVRNDSTNTVAGALFYADLGTGADGKTYFNTFTATATTTYILLYSKNANGGTSAYDAVSVTLELDRSANNKGLNVLGTITKQPVATGADLVGYSGFTTSNKLENRSDYDFGTGDSVSMCIIGWFKTTNISTYTYIMSVYDSGTDHVAGLAINSTSAGGANPAGTLYVYDSVTAQTSGTILVNDGQWHCAVGIFDGPTRKIYLDGKLEVSNTYTSYSLDIVDTDKLTVGRYAYNDDYNFLGSLALTRISKSIPSAEQIKKIYEDEKVLFQENAKATLYGTSDAVTALAYDDSTNLLYAGTSAGRSEFQGLRRINNTTTAVTTAISASNGLIAEQ
jgi:hypothetical protein